MKKIQKDLNYLVVNGDGWSSTISSKQNTSNIWATILSDKINLKLKNLSVRMSSNDRIFRTTFEDSLIDGYIDSLVIIGWSDPIRREVHCTEYPMLDYGNIPNTRWRQLTFNRTEMETIPNGIEWDFKYKKIGWDYVESMVRFSQQVILLSDWFDKHDINYLFFNSWFDPIRWYNSQPSNSYEKSEVGKLFEHIDWSKWLSFNNTTDSFAYNVCKYYNELTESLRPTEYGHRLIANHIYKEVINREII